MAAKKLVIFGTGGFAREVHQIVEDINTPEIVWDCIGFLDDDPQKHGMKIHDLPVLGALEWLEGRDDTWVSVAIGNTKLRRKVVERIRQANSARFATLIHPLAWVGNRNQIGEGAVLAAGARVSTDILIKDHVILNKNVTLGHDVVLEEFVTLAPSVNVSGTVRVEMGCDLGASSTVIQNITIGRWTVVGAGAVVVSNLPPNVTAVGVPAKVIKERPDGWHKT